MNTRADPNEFFSGQVALVSGAGSALGRALVEAFAAAGGVVAASDPSPSLLERTTASRRARRGQVTAYGGEIKGRQSVQSLAERVFDDWGRLDVLVNCAGFRPPVDFLDLSESDWRQALEINLSLPFFLMQAAARLMARQGGGVILNLAVAEAAALRGAQQSAYLAGKMGLVSLTRAAARELEGDNIRVHALCPAGLPEDAPNGLPPDIFPEAAKLMEGVVRLALYLCSPASAHLTGQILVLNPAQDDDAGDLE